jgi:hypothetical protein
VASALRKLLSAADAQPLENQRELQSCTSTVDTMQGPANNNLVQGVGMPASLARAMAAHWPSKTREAYPAATSSAQIFGTIGQPR